MLIERSLPREAEDHEERTRIWKAEVTFPFIIRVPVDISLIIGQRTITVNDVDQRLPAILVEWLKTSLAHRDKLLSND